MSHASLLAALLLVGTPGLACARCPAPAPPASIPSGATATREQMAQAQREIRAFDGALGAYRQCLLGELTQKEIGRPPEERKALQKEVIRPYMELWTKLTWMADCFNAELRTFRATGGGKKATPADCSSYVPRAMEAASAPPPPPPESPPPSSADAEAQGSPAPQAVAHGTWYYRLVRSEHLQPCRFRGAPECTQVRVEVENRSTSVLECRAQAELNGNNNEGVSHLDMPGVVLPGRTRPVLKTLLPNSTTVISSATTCAEREPLAPLDVRPECRFQIARPVSVQDYYPTPSRRLGEEGPVALQFVLPDKEGKATHIRVIGSSLFKRLDAAATSAIADMVFTTACPGSEFRMQLVFNLD